ncbi:MAG: hypothetical protein AAB657_01695 [Patescibacteria group bacterium]
MFFNNLINKIIIASAVLVVAPEAQVLIQSSTHAQKAWLVEKHTQNYQFQ